MLTGPLAIEAPAPVIAGEIIPQDGAQLSCFAIPINQHDDDAVPSARPPPPQAHPSSCAGFRRDGRPRADGEHERVDDAARDEAANEAHFADGGEAEVGEVRACMGYR